jgi:hypothetical protein
MNPIPFDKTGIPEEILKLCPPTTAAQAAARRKADEELEAKYPVGCYLAYLDNWTGDELNRVVVAASTDWDEYQRQLKALPPDIGERTEIDRIRDPEEGLRGLYPRLVEGD